MLAHGPLPFCRSKQPSLHCASSLQPPAPHSAQRALPYVLQVTTSSSSPPTRPQTPPSRLTRPRHLDFSTCLIQHPPESAVHLPTHAGPQHCTCSSSPAQLSTARPQPYSEHGFCYYEFSPLPPPSQDKSSFLLPFLPPAGPVPSTPRLRNTCGHSVEPMEIPRIASPSSRRVLDQMSYHDRRLPASRSDSQPSSSSSSHPSRAPMAIPHNRPAEAPPPLPPPRFIEDLANGHDLGWRWGNSFGDGGSGRLAPIKPSSSLNGGYRRSLIDTNRDEEGAEEMDVDGDFDRRGSTVSTIRSPSHPEVFPGSLGYIHSGGKRTPSPSALSNQRLAHFSFLNPVASRSDFLHPHQPALVSRHRATG